MGVHDLSMTGRAGSILWSLVIGGMMYTVGFATSGWVVRGNYHIGLWETCTCSSTSAYGDYDWFKATQAMITIGLGGLILTLICAILYIFVSCVNKNTMVGAMALLAIISVVFMTIGLVIFGIKTSKQSYSFAFTVLGGIGTLFAAVLSILQWKRST